MEKNLPGLTALKTWGRETGWEELQKFAVRNDRWSKQEAEKRSPNFNDLTGSRQPVQRRSDRIKNQGRNVQKEPRYQDKFKTQRDRESNRTNDYQRRGRSPSRGRQGKQSAVQFHKHAPTKNNPKPQASTYVSREEWDKLTADQQSKIREQRAKMKSAGNSVLINQKLDQ